MEKTLAELEAATAVAKTASEAAGGTDEGLNKALTDAEAALSKAKAPSQNTGRTEAERAAYSLRKNAERARELGIDPAEVLGITSDTHIDDEISDDTPLTVGLARKMQVDSAHKTALQMADELPDDEKDEVKTLLTSRIKPSGNADEDLRIARTIVNGGRNAKIIEHITQKPDVKRTAPGGSMGTSVEEAFNPTPEEARMMQPPYNLSKEKIIAARPKSQ